MSSFVITAMPTAIADQTRRAPLATSVERVVLDESGAPCRHCLEPGRLGEEMLLFSYQPFEGASPYAVPSPVFIHGATCNRYPETKVVPALVRSGLRAVRSYDAAHRLVDGDVVDGPCVETVIDRLLSDERAAYAHVYSATAGCFTCRVDRR